LSGTLSLWLSPWLRRSVSLRHEVQINHRLAKALGMPNNSKSRHIGKTKPRAQTSKETASKNKGVFITPKVVLAKISVNLWTSKIIRRRTYAKICN